MDMSRFNTYAGFFLGTVFAVLSINMISEAIFHTEAPEKPGYIIEVAEGGGAAATEGSGEAAAPEAIGPLLASADAAKGATVFKKCAACHTAENGGANKVGPNLWNIVNRPVASHEGFSYSAAMKAHADGGKTWDYDSLDHFITKPKSFVSGTSMGFAGIGKIGERADLIAYLRSLSDSPAPLPQ